ncbi:MAG: hypothetical protein Q3988_03785 [Gemella sp.]|nr:hypothetical protein [Gemella sp.]
MELWYDFLDIVFRFGFPLLIIVGSIVLMIMENNYWEWVNKGGYDNKEDKKVNKKK